MEKHSVSRMIGAPPGYVGYEEGGALTEAVRRRPYQVILMDEIEKAHHDVFNTLLQVLDDGRLTDGQGRTVDFRNTVIILTSNMGSEIIAQNSASGAQGTESPQVRDQVMEVVRSQFRPEFLNRLDEILIFHSLTREEMSGIVDIQADRLRQMLADRKIDLELDAPAKHWLAEAGFDAVYGARPLKRVIQRQLQNPLAEKLLRGEIGDGTTVRVTADDSGLRIEAGQTGRAAGGDTGAQAAAE
jgi:ATP-dependent Clp protease ATP-binding subunit ClpB